MKKISAEIIADSLNTFGNRITTFKLIYPRIIHSELMTHRVFSRNAASSRAVPVKKIIESVRNNMFTPLAVQKAHKGMQGSDYFEGVELEQAKQLWIESAELALQQAEKMEKFGITKQLINRILEPYQYYQVLVTATEWENFFELRAPKYKLIGLGGEPVKSRKDWLKKMQFSSALHPSQYPKTEEDWWILSESSAEIHIQALAEAMWDAQNESIPKQLQSGQWHIPFSDKLPLAISDKDQYGEFITLEEMKSQFNDLIKVATARTARLSYLTFDGELDYEKDIKLHDKLLESKHMSPFEHCARAMDSNELLLYRKVEHKVNDSENLGWCDNFKGFISYRYMIEKNIDL